MKHGKLFQESREILYEEARNSFFSHRTDPKPRPEGYRDFSEEGTIGRETLKMVGRGMFLPEDDYYTTQKPEEALESSQTDEVPPEPSKGLHGARGGVETASLLWIEDPLQKIIPNWSHPGWSNPPK